MSKVIKEDVETFFPEGKEIKLRGEKIRIKPFVLKTRMVVLRFVSEILGELVQNNPNLKSADAKAVGIALITTAGDRMLEIYRVVVEKPDEWLEQLTLVEEVKILKTVSEVNDFPFLLREIQKLYEASEKSQ